MHQANCMTYWVAYDNFWGEIISSAKYSYVGTMYVLLLKFGICNAEKGMQKKYQEIGLASVLELPYKQL